MSLDTFLTDLREKKSDTFTENELKRLFSVISELLGGKKLFINMILTSHEGYIQWFHTAAYLTSVKLCLEYNKTLASTIDGNLVITFDMGIW